jgi:hypothetical protein
MSTVSWSAYCDHSGVSFCGPHTQRRYSCTKDTLFVFLVHCRTPRYIIDEVCVDSQKKRAECWQRHGRPTETIPEVSFCGPHTQWRYSCTKDALFVFLMHYRTPRYIIDEVCVDSQKKMAECVDSVKVGLLWPFQSSRGGSRTQRWQDEAIIIVASWNMGHHLVSH